MAESLLTVFETFHKLRLRNREQKTLDRYRWTLRKFALFLGREATTDDLTNERVLDLLDYWKKKIAPRTVNNIRSYLLCLWRFANRQGIVALGPDIDPIPEPETCPRAFRLEEIQTLIAALRLATGDVYGVPAPLYWEALVRAIFDSGERISAVLQWDWSMLDLQTGWLSAPGRIRKGKRKSKAYRLREATLEVLRKFPKKRGKTFPWELKPERIYHHFHKLVDNCGLPVGRAFCFHALRKSHASYLEAAGGDATESLGHSNRRLTQTTYLDASICGAKQWADLLPDVA